MSEYRVPIDHDGRRVDRLIRSLWKDVPLGAIMKAIRTGQVRLDGKKISGDERIHTGQIVLIPWDLPQLRKIAPQKKVEKPKEPLETLYKDDNIWCVNKPAGLLSQPDIKGGDSLVTRALRELQWTRSDFSPVCVHRLDRNTSGIMIIALSGRWQRLLSQFFRERLIKKVYWAVVEGKPPVSGQIDVRLKKNEKLNRVTAHNEGEEALTLYKRLATADGFSLMELQLVTGRPHQARAHLASLGHPILGDAKYGGHSNRLVKRPFLHARSIEMPREKELGWLSGQSFTASLPDDMMVFFGKVGWLDLATLF